MLVCGVDEAGRGPLAGPVVAAAVVMPDFYENRKIKDSKQLSPEEREELVQVIERDAVAWAIVAVGPRRIEKFNILRASLLAMKLAVERIGHADLVLVDGNQPIATSIKQRTVIAGDALHVQISAASILAKTRRDAIMETLHRIYPMYGFKDHAGYPTPAHRKSISANGPCRVHRRTFAGVKEFLSPDVCVDGSQLELFLDVSSDPSRGIPDPGASALPLDL